MRRKIYIYIKKKEFTPIHLVATNKAEGPHTLVVCDRSDLMVHVSGSRHNHATGTASSKKSTYAASKSTHVCKR